MFALALLGCQVLLALAAATALEGYTVREGVPLSALLMLLGAGALAWLGVYAGRAVWRRPPRLW